MHDDIMCKAFYLRRTFQKHINETDGQSSLKQFNKVVPTLKCLYKKINGYPINIHWSKFSILDKHHTIMETLSLQQSLGSY